MSKKCPETITSAASIFSVAIPEQAIIKLYKMVSSEATEHQKALLSLHQSIDALKTAEEEDLT